MTWLAFLLFFIAACAVEFFIIREKISTSGIFWEKYFEEAVVLYVGILVTFFAFIMSFLKNNVIVFYVLLFGTLFCFYYFCFSGMPFLVRRFKKQEAGK